MDESQREAAKRTAGERAAEEVSDGDVVGLGTGSTAAHAIGALGERAVSGLDVVGVPTSYQSADLAREAGIPVRTLDDVGVDIAIDGADQIAGTNAIKGGGGSHAREKVVDASADRLLYVIDPTKKAEVLDRPVPVEVLPMARSPVAEAITDLGGEPELRSATGKSGPVVTDNGNLLLDCEFGSIREPEGLADSLASIPGVVEHGLFCGLADAVVVGGEPESGEATLRSLS
ncbi:ribose-5-phosphate isomerase RpiA [Natronorarus salvus]|uniref:ribose-5-phosphate isomerase RpiA n=1 Tax=Natronorarus salvus TaxID=3117733 RepID=UPI002F2651BD